MSAFVQDQVSDTELRLGVTPSQYEVRESLETKTAENSFLPRSETGSWRFRKESTGEIQDFFPVSENAMQDKVKAEIIEGQVESIDKDFALVVFETPKGEFDRYIPLKRLADRGANFEGARIRLIIKEEGGIIESRIENISQEKQPVWMEEDEELEKMFQRSLERRNKQNLNK